MEKLNPEMALVSVIIPCYNQGRYLQQAVDSVLASTYENIEIIVVNDGSYQDVEVLKTFSAQKTKIINQENQGVSIARNNGIRESKGKYILPLDADDKIHPEYIEKAVKVFNNNKIGIVYSEAEFFGSKTGKWNLEIYKFPNILYKNVIFCSALFRKSDWENINGYKQEMNLGCEDWEFWITLIENGAEVYQIPERLFYYRQHENIRTYQSTKLLTFFRIRKKIIKFHQNMYKKNLLKIFLPMLFESIRNVLSCIFQNKGNFIQKGYRKLFKKQLSYLKKQVIVNKLNNFNEFALTEVKRSPKLIVSLTSFPERIKDIIFTLYSLLNQSMKPDEVILWLAEEEFPNKENDIDENVLKLKKNGLSIKWCKNLGSYKKLVPALKEYPNDLIITADDDIYYPENFIELLYNSYLENSEYIHCHRAYKINLNKENQILPYCDWEKEIKNVDPSFLNFPTSGGGILFPSGLLHEDVINEELFLKLAPTEDDIWFWAMSLLKGTKLNVVKNNINNLISVNSERGTKIEGVKTLYSQNKNGGSDRQLGNVLGYYPQILSKLVLEKKDE